MKKSIYISGKITGLDEKVTRERFKKVQKELEDIDCKVLNPFEICDNIQKMFKIDSLSWGIAMIHCLESILDGCDEIYMLEGWADSPGARIERDFASRLGLVIRYEDLETKNF